MMRKTLLAPAIATCIPAASRGEEWSIGAATGPFTFGHFVERTTAVGTETGTGSIRSRLSAATRPGAAVDVGRNLNDWLAVRGNVDAGAAADQIGDR